MPAKRLAVLIVSVLALVSGALAQINQISVTAGRIFVSTETVPSTGLPVHFGNPISYEANYARLLKTPKFFGVYAELPVAVYPRMTLNYGLDQVPRSIGAVFVTPSVRVNFFPNDTVTPWV